jgi:hypothetical protein
MVEGGRALRKDINSQIVNSQIAAMELEADGADRLALDQLRQ